MFLARASTLSLALPGIGAALAACSPGAGGSADSVRFELACDIPGEFPFVNHGFGHGQKGAIGFLVVKG